MAISSEQRGFLMRSGKAAIARHYGDEVPTLDVYTRRKRATFMEKLKIELGASKWYARISDAQQTLSHIEGVRTKLRGNFRVKQEELRAERDKRLAEVEAQYQADLKKATLHYEPKLNEQDDLRRNAQKELSDIERESYFAAIGEEDDGRYLYGTVNFDTGIDARVDTYIENSLEAEELGAKVAQRMEEEQLFGDVAYISKNVEAMREAVLRFIESGDLPPITIKAWNIIDGQDTLGR